ncbi:hypothetical protein GCM10010222_00200 [Streptomyces tanashiensis]|nr:hypothetical protein GCM10010222_00200 [Streptomyces tanashiensis]
MAVMPELSLIGAPPSVGIADLGPARPTRSVGHVATPELARSLTVRSLIREPGIREGEVPSQIVGSPSNCGDR